MQMRRVPMRGEKYHTRDGLEITILEAEKGKPFVRAVAPSGKIQQFVKDEINLEVINTAQYEKVA